MVGVAEVAHRPGSYVLDLDPVHAAGLGQTEAALENPRHMEMQVGGRLFPLRRAGVRAGFEEKRAENGPSRCDCSRTSATRCRHTLSGASRPVITAPWTTTVRDI